MVDDVVLPKKDKLILNIVRSCSRTVADKFEFLHTPPRGPSGGGWAASIPQYNVVIL